MKEINGGVVAAKGFYANGINAGIRKKTGKRDLALIYTEKKAVAASMYTSNKVKVPLSMLQRIIFLMAMLKQ